MKLAVVGGGLFGLRSSVFAPGGGHTPARIKTSWRDPFTTGGSFHPSPTTPLVAMRYWVAMMYLKSLARTPCLRLVLQLLLVCLLLLQLRLLLLVFLLMEIREMTS